MRNGDFSGLGRAIRDPLTGQPFPGNIIPQDRISNASRFFLPYVLQRQRARPLPRGRADREQHLPVHGAPRSSADAEAADLRPLGDERQRDPGPRIHARSGRAPTPPRSTTSASTTPTRITPTTLVTATVGYLKSDNKFTSDTWVTGQNLLEQAGIRGIPTAGREDFLGPPNVNITGYQAGFGSPAFGVPGRLWSDVWNAKVSVTSVRGTHSLSAGYERNDRSVYARHGSHSPRGSFDFNAQYTGDGFADYLLGLTSGTRRNYPLETFGLESSPYTGAFIQDFWRARSGSDDLARPALRALEREEAGERQRRDVRSGDRQGDRGRRRERPGESERPADRAVPRRGHAGPVGAGAGSGHPEQSLRSRQSLRPAHRRDLASAAVIEDFVVRGGYGTYYSGFTGNRSASSIVGLPYWTWEALSYSNLHAAALGNGVAGESPELHPAVGRRSARLEHRRGEDPRVQRLGAEGTAVAVRADRVLRRHARGRTGVAEPVQRSGARRVCQPAGGEAVSAVRRDQRAREPRKVAGTTRCSSNGSAASRTGSPSPARIRSPRTPSTPFRRTRPIAWCHSRRPAIRRDGRRPIAGTSSW